MEADNTKLSLKRVEISLNNFNAIAIPYHIDLLNKHKSNIAKFQGTGDLERIKNEQINATRVMVQLRHLLEEMELLHQRVRVEDQPKFHRLTETSRNLTLKAIKEYIDMPQYSQGQSFPSVSSGYSSQASSSTQDTKSETMEPEHEKLSLRIDEDHMSEDEIRQRELCLKSWESLQEEAQDLQEIFVKFQQVVATQKEKVSIVDSNVQTVSMNIETGTRNLAYAERLRTAWYPLVGALIGGCIAGPMGLLTGMKIGGLAFLSGSALGFTGGRILKKKKEMEVEDPVTTDDSKKID